MLPKCRERTNHVLSIKIIKDFVSTISCSLSLFYFLTTMVSVMRRKSLNECESSREFSGTSRVNRDTGVKVLRPDLRHGAHICIHRSADVLPGQHPCAVWKTDVASPAYGEIDIILQKNAKPSVNWVLHNGINLVDCHTHGAAKMQVNHNLLSSF